jgi:hypothetical protein
MPGSSTGDEALNNGAAEGENLPGAAGQSIGDTDKGVTTEGSPATESKDDNKPKDIADAVRAALNPKEEQSSSSGEGEGEEPETDPAATEGDKPAEGEEEDLGELTDEELDKYKPKTKRRFEKLRAELKDRDTKISDLEPEAKAFRDITTFAKQSNLSPEDVNTGFEVMRLMRNDPIRAYQVLTPIYTELQAIAGEILPADLQEQVNTGQIALPAAKELSRLRATQGVQTNMQKQNEERAIQRQNEEAQQATESLKHGVVTAITDWESQWKASDPDYSLKSSRVNEAIELELTRAANLARAGKPNNLPRTVEEAVKLANEVKKRVEKELRAFVPKRNNPIVHVTGNGVTNGSKPQVNDMRGAVLAGLGRK